MKTLIRQTCGIIVDLYWCTVRAIMIWAVIWFGSHIIHALLVDIRVHGL